MAQARVSDEEFLELWAKHGSAAEISRIIGVNIRNVSGRRARLEQRYGKALPSKNPVSEKRYEYRNTAKEHPSAISLGIENGHVVVFSDAHFWPGIHTTAYRGLVKLIEELQPKAVICNGDAFDGASASRHAPIMWEEKPSIIEELKACEIALGEIDDTTKKARHNARLIWPLGNHCARFESRIASVAPEYKNVAGTRLADHFPNWEHCWAVWPTEETIIKHRWKGGIHATHNNTVSSGKNIITGHLHSLKCTPWTDYNGTRYGVDTGTLAEPHGPQFDYVELNPLNWRSGFVVLTFHNGRLLMPELVQKWDDDHVEFRGQLIKV